MPQINAVLFDYGLVLSGPPDPAAWNHLKHLLTADEPAFHQAYWDHREAYDRGALTAPAYWQQVGTDLHQTLTSQQLNNVIEADTDVWTQPNQPMIDFAYTLQRAGIRTGILSNIGDAMEDGILARFPWLHAFHHHTFSHRLNLAKPNPEIYVHAITGLGVPAAEILFIDDREDNILAARAAGMQAIQYTTHDAFLHAMRQAGFDHLLFR
jgi:putative hydrolase of the HAD superfamily